MSARARATTEKTATSVLNGGDAPAQSPAPLSVQRDAPLPAAGTPPCNTPEIFTELDLPWYVGNRYFRGSKWLEEEKTWRAELGVARKGKCEAKGQFEDIELSWDLGNPALGKVLKIVDLNKNSVTFNLNPHVVYFGKPCCSCFSGVASWSCDVSTSRKQGGKTETGKTKAPITGSKAGKTCDGKKCCSVDQTMNVNLSMGTDEIDTTIKGRVTLQGALSDG